MTELQGNTHKITHHDHFGYIIVRKDLTVKKICHDTADSIQ